MRKSNKELMGDLAEDIFFEKMNGEKNPDRWDPNGDGLLNKNIVKVQTEGDLEENKSSKAIDFFRKKREIEKKNIYHHIGIYEYKVSTLETFSKLEQTENEIKNKLEQLRALDNHIDIDVVIAKNKVIGVDTDEDYIELKKIMEYKN